MKKVIVYSFVIILFSCSSKKQEKDVSFETIYSSFYGGIEEYGYEIIDNDKDYTTEINRLGIEGELEEKNIDFKKNNILFLHLGLKNSGGYNIDVEKIEVMDKDLIIFQKITSPIKGENVTMALTNPYCVVKIPKAENYTVK